MANRFLEGDAPDIAQETELVLTGIWTNGDTLTITISDVELILTIGTTVDIPTVLDNMIVMLTGTGTFDTGYSSAGARAGNTSGVFAELNKIEDGIDTVTLTASRAGRPYTLTSSEVTVSTGVVTQTTTVANSSRNDYTDAKNWSGKAVPIAGDVVILENSDVDLLYNLDQSAIALVSFDVRQSYTGKLGLPEINPGGGIPYAEYRGTFFQTSSPLITIGEGPGAGSGRIKIDSGATATVVINVINTGSPTDINEGGAFIWKGTGGANVDIIADDGFVGIGTVGLDNADFGDLTILEATVLHLQGSVANVFLNGEGSADITPAIATLIRIKGTGSVTARGDLPSTTGCIVEAGTLFAFPTATVTALLIDVFKGGTLDTSKAAATITLSNLTDFHPGSKVFDPLGKLIFSSEFTVPGGAINEVDLNLGKDRTSYNVTA